jgi:glycosyltransferase involved in cell wall biosynthesis
MKNILFVSIAFPPKSDAEGLQVAKYLKYLVREGAPHFNVDAVTSALPTLNIPYDASLEALGSIVRQTVEVPIYENRYSNFLLRKVMPWTAAIPDPKFSFHLQAGKVLRLLKVKPDLIYSRSFPLSSALMALKLKRKYNVPWVMHLSDLWVDCPERRYGGLAKVLQEKYERTCFESADVICVTSEKTRAFYLNKYRELAPRIEYFPNVFDLEDRLGSFETEARGRSDSKFRIVHTGSLVGQRSPGPFLKALTQLGADIQDRLEVIFVGPVDMANMAELRKWKLPYLSVRGPVEYKESLQIQRSADLLLLIDLPVPEPDLRVYFPSKMLDYILSGRPILALTDEGSEIRGVANAHNVGTCIDRHDTPALVKFLTEAARTDASENRPLSKAHEVYSAQYNAQRLVQLFRELIAGESDERNHGGRLWNGQPSVG